MECSICKNKKFKNNRERNLHIISDEHIKRVLEPKIWDVIDGISEKIKQIEVDDSISPKEKIKIIKKLELEKRQATTKENVLDFDLHLNRSSNISKSIIS